MELNCIFGGNNETSNNYFSFQTISDGITNSCSMLLLFLQNPLKVSVTVAYGLLFLLVDYLVYRKTREGTGPPSLFSLSNIGICSIFFAIMPTVKYHIKNGLLIMTGQMGCSIYAFFNRAFIVLLPVSMIQIVYESSYGKLIVGNYKLKLRILIHILILVFNLAFPGACMMEFSDGKCNLVILNDSKLFHTSYEIVFWFFSCISYYLIAIKIVCGLKNKKHQLEGWDNFCRQVLHGEEVAPRGTRWGRWIAWILTLFIVIMIGRECYLLVSKLLDVGNMHIELSNIMINEYEGNYYKQLVMAPAIFWIFRRILCNEKLDPMPFLKGWPEQRHFLTALEVIVKKGDIELEPPCPPRQCHHHITALNEEIDPLPFEMVLQRHIRLGAPEISQDDEV